MSSGFKELPVISSGILVHTPKATDPILGIDLGTTNSLVAIVQDGTPRVIPTLEGKNILPSVVRVLNSGNVLTGFAARDARTSDSNHIAYSVKRLMGKGRADVEKIRDHLPFDVNTSSETNVKIKLGSAEYTPIEISSFILRDLKLAAEKHLGREVEDAVITVPAYFNDSQRQATRMAGRLAGLNVLRILNEPTAASLAYGIQKKKSGLIAVYDLGGGTFDVSILRLRDGIFEVLSTNGNTELGGDDMDRFIAQAILPGKDLAKALDTAEKLKIALTDKDRATIDGVTLSRSDLEKIIAPVLESTRAPVVNALNDAGVSAPDLTDVVLVGGPTRIPALQKFVTALFGRTPNTSMHPDEVVALGAAVQADILAGNNKDMLLLDVVPLSLGIETFGGAMNKLIPRNTRIPALAKEQFTTFVEGQTKVAINVFQGERDLVEHNRKLGEFVLHGIPPLPAGAARVEVTFLVDADGILNVSAKELYSEIQASIEMKPKYGLTDNDVEKLLSDYLTNASGDAAARQAIEARNDAQAILTATEKGLKLRHLLPKDEAEKIDGLIAALKQAMKGSNADAIKQAHKALDKGTVHLAEIMMNQGLTEGMKNQSVDKFVDKSGK